MTTVTTTPPMAHPSHVWKAIRLHGALLNQCSQCGAREGSAASRKDCAEMRAKYHAGR